jgi:hypothetical protein
MGYCGVVEVRSLEDALGATCGRQPKATCSDCGVPVCSFHAERCQICRETFCPSCLSFHSVHAKPAGAPPPVHEKRRSA